MKLYNVIHCTVLNTEHAPRCVLHRGQEATVHEWPGNQEKWLSAGQCFRTSARLKVTTSNWKPCGFSKSWTETRFPAITVSFRCDRARRLGSYLRSVSSATSCPQDRHSISPEHPRPNRALAHNNSDTTTTTSTHRAARNMTGRNILRETSRHWHERK